MTTDATALPGAVAVYSLKGVEETIFADTSLREFLFDA